MNTTSIFTTLATLSVLAVAGACGGDDDDKSGGHGGSGGGSATGACAPANAATACGSNCAFDPATIDCAAACTNVAAVCAKGDCGAQCTGLNQDVGLCTTACEATKTLSCTNVTFGCYASSSDCTAVGSCVNGKI